MNIIDLGVLRMHQVSSGIVLESLEELVSEHALGHLLLHWISPCAPKRDTSCAPGNVPWASLPYEPLFGRSLFVAVGPIIFFWAPGPF